ncbi:competence/damage-inducible protein A [Labilibaculum sp. DW002]|uniref:CinA-like protein n=1 Tax=Paralabilibaculum antarcticum TaxID=2912572 RepID=A0ABT5VQI8_9BACT|nr:competence/damage-inducible protein A [Labilibaculum sp. DW002]MDE5416534.1 competence/damage-inducible protein A [Labilibaculum sp. DW002]
MQAEIITIGDEILIGQIVDTNSAWMAKELNAIGINVSKITSISDQKEDIVSSMEQAMERVSLVLITGGLGPTNDDITKKTLSDFFEMALVQDDLLYERIKERLAARGIPMNRFNEEQALVPDRARIITNNYGTAPCMWFEKEGKVIISMPGVPFEMKGIMRNGLLGNLTTHFSTSEILHKTVMVQGIGESVLAEMLEEWEANLPTCVKLAYLPSPGVLRLRLSLIGEDRKELERIVEEQTAKLIEIIPENIFGFDDQPMELAVAKLLSDKGKTVGTAESCTGGNIAHLFTSHAGSSIYFKGAVVAYSNEIKESVLKVNADVLLKFGAVSQQVVEQMAMGVRDLLNVDYAIATSGIAGPDGGTDEKPVGTVWVAIAGPDHLSSTKLDLYKNRERNIKVASLNALNMLRKLLEK